MNAPIEAQTLRVGPNVFKLEAYGPDVWRCVECPAIRLLRRGRSWVASVAIGLEYLGPYAPDMATLSARATGNSREEAEARLNAELEALRRLLGPAEVSA